MLAPRPLIHPEGRFARRDQQGNATEERVLDAILHTPVTGDVKRS